jgi:hypothetical protein
MPDGGLRMIQGIRKGMTMSLQRLSDAQWQSACDPRHASEFARSSAFQSGYLALLSTCSSAEREAVVDHPSLALLRLAGARVGIDSSVALTFLELTLSAPNELHRIRLEDVLAWARAARTASGMASSCEASRDSHRVMRDAPSTAPPPSSDLPPMPLEEIVAQQAPLLYIGERPEDAALDREAVIAAAHARGQRYLNSLIRERQLLPAEDFARSWGISVPALEGLQRAGRMLALAVHDRLWYPALLTRFPSQEDAERVCAQIGAWPAIEQFLVLTNAHAALGEITVTEALVLGMRNEVTELLASLTEGS